MHLLTLLIAAVFSSQFSKLNGAGDPAAYTVTPEFVKADATEKVTVTETAETQIWSGTVSVLLTLDNTAAPLDDDERWEETTPVVEEGKPTIHELDEFNFGGLDKIEDATTVYVYVKVGDDVLPEDPAEITVEKPWGLTAAQFDEDSFAIKDIVVTHPIPAWEVKTGATDKVTVYVNDEEVAEGDLLTKQDWIGSQESEQFGNGKYEITSLRIPAHKFAENDTIYLYVKYVNKTDDTPTFDKTPQTIETKAATLLYEIKTPEDKEIAITDSTIEPLVISKKAQPAWENGAAKLRLTLDSSKDPATLPDINFDTNATLDHTLNKLELYTLGRRFKDDKIYVYISVKDGDDVRVLTKFEQIAVTGETPLPTFDVTKPAKIIKSTMTTFELVVKEKGQEANEGTWEEKVAFFITADPKKAASHSDTWVEAAADGDSFKATMTLANLGLADATKAYVWVMHSKTTTAGSGIILPAPVELSVQASPDPTFEVNKPTAITEEKLADPIDFEITPLTAGAWDDEDVVVTISTSTTSPSGEEIPFTKALTPPEGTATAWTATIDLSAMKVEDITDNLYVHVKVGENEYDPGYESIPFTPAEKPAFTVTKPTKIEESKKATPVDFEIEPKKDATWASAKLTVSIKTDTPTGVATEEVTINLDEPDQDKTAWTAAVDLSTLEVPADQDEVYVHVKVGSDEYFDHYVAIPYEHADEPDPVTFTIAPKEMNFGEDLTTPVITVTPSENHKWPTGPETNFKAIFTYKEKPEITKAIAVSDADPPVYTIPATALTGFDIKEADLPAEITVAIHDNTKELDHTVKFTVKAVAKPEAAMGVSPLFTLLAALVFLFVKLF